jgi:hypothetical protein
MNIVDTVSSGLIVVNNINDNSYYMQETPNWNRTSNLFLLNKKSQFIGIFLFKSNS